MIVNNRLSFEFSPNEKVAMYFVLDQFAKHYATVHLIKNCLLLPGTVVMDSQEAFILARLIGYNYPLLEDRILSHPGLENRPHLTPDEWKVQYASLMEKVG